VKIAFDTSVLVAATVGSHPRHPEAASQVELARQGEHTGFICTHALAELYSVLTKIPLQQRVSPSEALPVVQALRDFLDVIPCDGSVYEAAIERCANRNLRSGGIFDALHLIAAETVQADVFSTFNVRDFERLQEAHSPRIVDSL